MLQALARTVAAVGRSMWFVIRIPYFLPRGIWRGIRRHVKEIGEPIDMVSYYSRGSGLRKALASNTTTIISWRYSSS